MKKYRTVRAALFHVSKNIFSYVKKYFLHFFIYENTRTGNTISTCTVYLLTNTVPTYTVCSIAQGFRDYSQGPY